MSTEDTSFRAAGSVPPKPNDRAFRSAQDLPLQPARSNPQQAALLNRARHLLGMHQSLAADGRKPPMWGLIVSCGAAIAVGMAYSAYQAVTDALPGHHDLPGVAFVVTFFVFLFVPDALLRLVHRSQKAVIRRSLEDALIRTIRSYPEEVEQCGGIAVLADRVELEALVHVLENQGNAESADGSDDLPRTGCTRFDDQ